METGTIALIVSIVALLFTAVTAIVLLIKRNKTRHDPVIENTFVTVEEKNSQKNSPDPLSVALSEAVSIEFLPSNIREQEETGLIFERINTTEEKHYREIILNNTSHVGSIGAKAGAVIGQQVLSMQELAAQAPNGLFTATTNPTTLTKFADGTVSTMVHGKHGVAAHYGFEQVKGISAINPAMVINMGMQGMAFVSGQYYLKRINERMDKLDSKVEQLMLFQKAEKVGDLKSDWEMLRKITSRDVVDDYDLDQIVRIIVDAGKVYEQYKILSDQKYKELKRFTGKSGIAEDKLKEYQQVILELQELLEICFIADQLKLKAEVAEIAVRRRINPQDPKIPNLLEELKSDIKHSFSYNTCENFEAFTSPIVKRAELMSMHHRGLGKALKSLFRGSEVVSEELLKPVHDQFYQMQNSLNSLVESEFYEKALTLGEENHQVLLMPGTGDQGQRMFVEISEIS